MGGGGGGEEERETELKQCAVTVYRNFHFFNFNPIPRNNFDDCPKELFHDCKSLMPYFRLAGTAVKIATINLPIVTCMQTCRLVQILQLVASLHVDCQHVVLELSATC